MFVWDISGRFIGKLTFNHESKRRFTKINITDILSFEIIIIWALFFFVRCEGWTEVMCHSYSI